MICKKVEFMKEITCAGRFFFLSGKGGKKERLIHLLHKWSAAT